MKILLTGCMGFIGSNTVPLLLNRGIEVVGIDNLSNPSLNPTDRMKDKAGNYWSKFKFYKCDVVNTNMLESILMNERVDAIIHLAASGSVPRSFSNPALTVYNNEYGFVALTQVAATYGIKRLVFASSSSVYGNTEEKFKTEGREGFPLSPYAISKKANEDFIRIWAPTVGINYVGLRFFNVYGPGQIPDAAFSAVIPRFITEEIPTVYGDGQICRDFTFVDDVAAAIYLALKCTEKKSTIVNVGRGQGISINSLLSILGKKATYTKARYGDVRVSVASREKAEVVLKFLAATSVEEGLKITKAFYESFKKGTDGKS